MAFKKCVLDGFQTIPLSPFFLVAKLKKKKSQTGFIHTPWSICVLIPPPDTPALDFSLPRQNTELSLAMFIISVYS